MQKITGYRELSEEEVRLINSIKEQAMGLQVLFENIDNHLKAQAGNATGPEWKRLEQAEPNRWFAMAKTDLQKGFMALTRTVAQPTTF